VNILPLPVPWLELAIVLVVVGAVGVGFVRDPGRAARWGLVFTGGACLATILACAGFYLGRRVDADMTGSLQRYLFGVQLLGIDELNAPLLPVVGLLQFLTALSTARTKMKRFSYAWSMAGEAVRLAVFSCAEPAALIVLLALETVSPLAQLVRRGKSARVYVLHMSLFVALLAVGQGLVALGTDDAWSAVPLLLAILVRCGTLPVHCWVPDLFDRASFGSALLFVAPITGAYAAVRLVLPVAPDWALRALSIVSLATAVYAAGMALVQRDARRFFAYLFVSHSSLVLVGLELVSPLGLTGALCLWFSAAVSLGGFGLTMRALEARFGRLALTDYRGLYGQSPALAVGFLVTGLAGVGFPGTLGFVAADLLVDGAIAASPYVGLAVAVAAALNGIAVLRAYFLLFTGARHASTVALDLGLRERIAVLTLVVLILGGGLVPQPGILTRHQAAAAILHERSAHFEPGPPAHLTAARQ
jgi:NADH-quinone oxidoreductase subunit M